MINFDELKEYCISQMNGGIGETKAKMFNDGKIKIMLSTLEVGCSIGEHEHKTSCEVIYVLSGECHYCPKGSKHSIVNNGKAVLVMFDVVPEL